MVDLNPTIPISRNREREQKLAVATAVTEEKNKKKKEKKRKQFRKKFSSFAVLVRKNVHLIFYLQLNLEYAVITNVHAELLEKLMNIQYTLKRLEMHISLSEVDLKILLQCKHSAINQSLGQIIKTHKTLLFHGIISGIMSETYRIL
jgi:hypothetical protein